MIDNTTMKQQKLWVLAAILIFCGQTIYFSSCSSCKSSRVETSFVAGTLDSPVVIDEAPAQVLEAIVRSERFHQYEIMSDTACNISVEAIAEVDTTSTGGFGIVVVKNAISTTFPNLNHKRSPMASYDKDHNTLWFTCNAMSGTGIQVDRLYQIRFGDNDIAYIAFSVEPYDLQQQLCQRLGYSIDGEKITLWDGAREIATVTNTVTDMGGFDNEQPVWIGEQIGFDLSGSAPRLLVTPGVKFTTGLVLTYDDMPTLSAPLSIADDGTVSIGDLEKN